MNKLFLAMALALAPSLATAETPAPHQPAEGQPSAEAASLPDADPAMWIVRDEDTTIYLLGTFHLLDARPWFNDEVKTAFDSADELVVEAIIPDNPSDIQPLVLRYAVDQQGRRLADQLNEEQNAKLAEALATVGLPAGAMNGFEPWFVSMTLSTVASHQLGISAAHNPEAVLIRAARERGIPVSELEGLEWQIRMLDGMPEAQQIVQLRQTLDGFDSIDDALAPMLTAWSQGDADTLHELLVGQAEADPELQRLLFTDRNRTWAQWLRDRMERPGTVFVAVGAGHLAGDDSVQAVLRESGIEAERVVQAVEAG
jgi:uncharacterized protein YbaP (TraB family)